MSFSSLTVPVLTCCPDRTTHGHAGCTWPSGNPDTASPACGVGCERGCLPPDEAEERDHAQEYAAAVWAANEPFVYRPHNGSDASYAVQRTQWKARVDAANARLRQG